MIYCFSRLGAKMDGSKLLKINQGTLGEWQKWFSSPYNSCAAYKLCSITESRSAVIVGLITASSGGSVCTCLLRIHWNSTPFSVSLRHSLQSAEGERTSALLPTISEIMYYVAIEKPGMGFGKLIHTIYLSLIQVLKLMCLEN